MIIAVITVRVMQVTIDEVVDMVAMRDRFVPAPGTMDVFRIMLTAIVRRGAFSRVGRAHWNLMLFDHPVVPHPVEMTVM